MAKPATRIAEAAISSKKVTDSLGRLPTVSHRPVIRREDERASIGPDLRTSPDGKCSCLPRSSRFPRRELSLWFLCWPGGFKLMVLLQWRVQRRWWTSRQVTARPQLTDRPQWTARPQVTARPQLTARPGTARQVTVRPVTAGRTARSQLIHLTAQLFNLMTRRSQTTLHVIRRWEWTGRQAMEPCHGTTPAGGPDASVLTGTSSPFFSAIPASINQATLIDFMSMWTLLQRRMDQGMVPDTSASLAVPSSVPAPRHDSSSRRSDTQSRTPERRPRTPEPRTPQRYPRTPVRRVRTPMRQARGYSDSRDSRSRSPLSRSSSVESPTRDASPVKFTASMDPDNKRSISDDEDDEGEHKKISAAQCQIFRQAVTTSKGSFKSTLLIIRQSERPGRLCWTWAARRWLTESRGWTSHRFKTRWFSTARWKMTKKLRRLPCLRHWTQLPRPSSSSRWSRYSPGNLTVSRFNVMPSTCPSLLVTTDSATTRPLFFLPSVTSDVSRHRRVGSEVRHLRFLSRLYGGFGNRRTLSQGWTL